MTWCSLCRSCTDKTGSNFCRNKVGKPVKIKIYFRSHGVCTFGLRAEEWVVCKQHTWDWQTLDFAFFMLEWTILKCTSDGFIKRSRLQSTQNGNLNKVFLWEKGKMAKCNFRNFRRFFFGMSSDIPACKVCVFANDFEFWIEVNEC